MIGLDVGNDSTSVSVGSLRDGLDVRHDCVSVPCLAYVTGLDVGNDSDERFYW